MSSIIRGRMNVQIFGQSHSEAIGVTVDGLPAGFRIDMQELQSFLNRRAPGRNSYSTARKEEDMPHFVSGLREGLTCGAPLTALIYNNNTRSKDYSELLDHPRPGHADYTANVKYGGYQDYAGGGHFSGRLTAPLCIAGGIAKQLLSAEGIEIISRISELAGISDEGELLNSTAEKDFPTVSDERGELMKAAILEAKAEGDSVGGIIECKVLNLPAGLGDPMFDGMENRIAAVVFGVPAVKGIEFGRGFESARLRGSENNDAFCIDESGRVVTATNNCGGILGGITNGMPLVFRAAIKPTPSISREQQTVELSTNTNSSLVITGRHDPCIVARAVPVIEAAAAIAVYNAFLER